jgi:hypothetical protein
MTTRTYAAPSFQENTLRTVDIQGIQYRIKVRESDNGLVTFWFEDVTRPDQCFTRLALNSSREQLVADINRCIQFLDEQMTRERILWREVEMRREQLHSPSKHAKEE